MGKKCDTIRGKSEAFNVWHFAWFAKKRRHIECNVLILKKFFRMTKKGVSVKVNVLLRQKSFQNDSILHCAAKKKFLKLNVMLICGCPVITSCLSLFCPTFAGKKKPAFFDDFDYIRLNRAIFSVEI